jgi:hypothetical protein
MRKRLLAGLVAASVISLAIFALMAFVGDVKVNTLQYEFAKILLQVGLVSAAGAAASMLGYEFQREGQRIDKDRDEKNRREEKTADENRRLDEKDRDEERRAAEKARDEERDSQEYRRRLLEGALERATASYFQVKRARRLLRALATTDSDSGTVAILASQYDREIVVIIDAQLEFESLAEHVRTNPAMFSAANRLASQFDDIEDYLNSLISEYEVVRSSFIGKPPVRELATMPDLDKFLASPRNQPDKFMHGFWLAKRGFRQVQTLIRHDLVENLSPAGAISASHVQVDQADIATGSSAERGAM